MEKENILKRAREEEDDETLVGHASENSYTKKQDVYGVNFNKEEKRGQENSSETSYSNLRLGVFDFPWLKDGVISKTEDYHLGIEDKFLSSFEIQEATFNDAALDFFEVQSLCETQEESSLAHLPEELEENVWLPFERDGLEFNSKDVDCIYSSLLNQPSLKQEDALPD